MNHNIERDTIRDTERNTEHETNSYNEKSPCFPHDDLTERTIRNSVFVCVACGTAVGFEQWPTIAH